MIYVFQMFFSPFLERLIKNASHKDQCNILLSLPVLISHWCIRDPLAQVRCAWEVGVGVGQEAMLSRGTPGAGHVLTSRKPLLTLSTHRSHCHLGQTAIFAIKIFFIGHNVLIQSFSNS